MLLSIFKRRIKKIGVEEKTKLNEIVCKIIVAKYFPINSIVNIVCTQFYFTVSYKKNKFCFQTSEICQRLCMTLPMYRSTVALPKLLQRKIKKKKTLFPSSDGQTQQDVIDAFYFYKSISQSIGKKFCETINTIVTRTFPMLSFRCG